jgi:diguanylate cyclase (GGDEF)-like protein/PAS domain S-box-containing protein
MDHEKAGDAVLDTSGVVDLRAPAWSPIFDTLPIGVGLWSLAGDLLHANPVLEDLLGLQRADAPRRLLEVIADDGRGRAATALDELRAGRRNSAECLLHGAPAAVPDATDWPLRAHVTVHFQSGGLVGGFLVQVFDFRRAEDGPPLPQGLSKVLEEGSDFLLVIDATGRITYGNRAARDALGVDSGGSTVIRLTDVLEPDSVELFDAVVARAVAEVGAWQGELAFRTPQGTSVPVSARFVAHGRPADPDGPIEPTDLSVFARDITELKNAERRLRQLATHDYLTGLPNRLLLYDRLELALNRYLRYGTPVALLFCDLDGFKPVNDRYGHQVGDTVLVEVSDRIHSVVRDTDTAARVGGDEFAVLIEGIDDLDQLTTVADRLVARVGEPVEVGAVRAEVGISIGLVVASRRCHEVDTMVALADAAMYRAKAAGRGRYVVVTGDDVPE